MSENNGAGVIISKVARLHEHIEKLLKQIDVGSLPGIVIEGPSSIGALPKKICGLYFLSHHDKGLFYIGKTRDLKTRFGYHEHLEAAIAFGGITLAWLELPGEIATFCEEFFIADRLPGWSKRIPLIKLATAQEQKADGNHEGCVARSLLGRRVGRDGATGRGGFCCVPPLPTRVYGPRFEKTSAQLRL